MRRTPHAPDWTALPRPDLLIFDVDGTLVDVRSSYRAVTPVAIARYLALLGLRAPELDAAVYDHFKLMGGFNNDWDLTAGCLAALLAPLPSAHPLVDGHGRDQTELVAALRAAAAPLAGAVPALPDWATFVPAVRAAGGGLPGLRRVVGPHNGHLICHTDEPAAVGLVERLFSELYLGGDLFARTYGTPARFHAGPGAVETERLIVSPAVLEALRGHARLGIATGRNDQELNDVWRRWDLAPLFDVQTTHTDAQAARAPDGPALLKPHPFLLERAADALDPTGRRVAAYIGDMPDDIVAARRAGGRRWLAIGIAPEEEWAAHLRELGADLVLRHPDELIHWWKDSESS